MPHRTVEQIAEAARAREHRKYLRRRDRRTAAERQRYANDPEHAEACRQRARDYRARKRAERLAAARAAAPPGEAAPGEAPPAPAPAPSVAA
jgi:hypothetical protein